MQANPIQYRFGEYLLDPRNRTLLRGGQSVEVQNQVFDLLFYLLEHPDQVVSKQTLLDEVWHNQYLTDATIAQAVKKARQAIGDDGQQQAVIRTVHGKGIRWVAPVERVLPDAEAVDSARRLNTPWIVAPIILLLLLVVVSWPTPNDPDSREGAADLTLAVFPFENATGKAEYQWLEYGLAETTSLLLELTDDVLVRHPDIGSEVPAGALAQRTAMLGVEHGLTATIAKDTDRFTVTWTLVAAGKAPNNGSFITADASTIARQLAEAVLAQMAERPLAPITDRPLLNDPLAVELFSRGTEALYQDDREQAVALLSAAQARAPDSLPLQIAVAIADFDANDIETSIQRYNSLLAGLPQEAQAERARLAFVIGDQLWYAGEMEQASQLLEQALANTSNAELLHARSLNSLSFVRQSQSNYDQAWEYAKQAEMSLRDIGDPYHLSMVLTNLGYLADDLGRIIEAGQYHQSALDIRSKYGFPSLIAASQYGLARIERRSGNFERADELLQQSLATVIELELPYDQFDNLEELAEVRIQQQRFAEAGLLLEEARLIADAAEDTLGQAWSDQMRARIKLRQGLADAQAFNLIESALAAFVDMGELQDALIARLELAQLLQLADRDDEAGALLQTISADPALNNPVLRLQRRRVEAALQAKQNGAQSALPEYQEIMRHAREIGVLDLEVDTAIDCGYLAIAAGDIDTAQRMLAIARAWSQGYYRTVNLGKAVSAAASE